MTDPLEVVSLVLALFGTIGVWILIYQWYVDNHSSKPYSVSFPLGSFIPPPSRIVQLEVLIKNRRSREARLSAWLSVPLPTAGRGLAYSGLDNTEVRSAIMGKLPRPFVLPGGETVDLIVSGEVREGSSWPGMIHLEIIDDRPGRRQFQYGQDFPAPQDPGQRC